MDFVHKNNGHENGWRKEDHQLFVKLYNKYKDVDILAKNLSEILPGKLKKTIGIFFYTMFAFGIQNVFGIKTYLLLYFHIFFLLFDYRRYCGGLLSLKLLT